ncbi:MAG TPA: phospholipid carrier-dependent glycosyltransferase [Vicinamibacterales bacterium]
MPARSLLIALLLLAALLRGAFLTADPPWRSTAGVVWHDEGAWTHNARNRALWGTWQADNWNPLYIAPVFTGLEYVAFAAAGVGTWQARLVPAIFGVLAVLCLGLGMTRVAGRHAGLTAAALLATNYVAVMYDRAALMEGPMSAFIVMAFAAFAYACGWPAWGLAAGVAALLAYFTKAAAASFVGALGITAVTCAWVGIRTGDRPRRDAGLWTLAGLAVGGLIALAVFVGPYWNEYRFYNWQMSVTRKPSYDIASLVTRVSWFPVLHDVLTRMWVVCVLGLAAWLPRAAAWWRRPPAEQLLVLWLGLGILQLLVHDVGNERRFVFLIPAFTALAALLLASDRTLLPAWTRDLPRTSRLLLVPLSLYAAYIAAGSVARLPFLYEVRPSVRTGAALALLVAFLVWIFRRRLGPWAAQAWSPRAAAVAAAVLTAGGVIQYGQWAAGRTYKNVEASRMLGRLLPPGTPVHGKLANGLALENRIRPIFVGREFGNYADRLTRNDVPFLLTYVAPRLGYEGPVILDVLEAYPQWRILCTFDVAETVSGRDRAALIEKGPPAMAAPPLRREALGDCGIQTSRIQKGSRVGSPESPSGSVEPLSRP